MQMDKRSLKRLIQLADTYESDVDWVDDQPGPLVDPQDLWERCQDGSWLMLFAHIAGVDWQWQCMAGLWCVVPALPFLPCRSRKVAHKSLWSAVTFLRSGAEPTDNARSLFYDLEDEWDRQARKYPAEDLLEAMMCAHPLSPAYDDRYGGDVACLHLAATGIPELSLAKSAARIRQVIHWPRVEKAFGANLYRTQMLTRLLEYISRLDGQHDVQDIVEYLRNVARTTLRGICDELPCGDGKEEEHVLSLINGRS